MTIRPGTGRRRGKPVAVVKQGSAAVPIYRGAVRGLTRFTVAFYRDGRRQRRTFGNLDAAKEEAHTVALNIQRGMSSDNDLRPQDREAFRTAQNMLAPLGVPLVVAVDEYVQCRRKLGDVNLSTSVEEYLRRARGFTASIKVQQVIQEFVAIKTQDRLSERYLRSIRQTFNSFGDSYPGLVAAITTQQIDGWIRRGEHCVATRNKWLVLLKEFFDFARRQGYLPKSEPTAAEALKIGKRGGTDVGIFKPEDMEKLLRSAKPDVLPILAIGGFAGLRAAEIARLDWSAVDLNRKIIELRAGQAKTASRRVVPISENLAAWLSPLNRQGPVVAGERPFIRARRHGRTEQIAWPHNALRHSYISYRIAVVQNAAQVALEAGNSPAIIFRHYRELVTKDEAEKWFAIMPLAN